MVTPFGLPETDFGPITSGIDKLLVQLTAGAVTDLAGNPLASDFTQRFDVLPGDATGDGAANAQDVGLTNFRGFLTIADPGPNFFGFSYDPFFDITGNGAINAQDVGLTNFQGFDQLPSGTPVSPGGDSGLGALFYSRIRDENLGGWRLAVDELFLQGYAGEALTN